MEPKTRPAFVSTQVLEAERYYLDLAPRASREIVVVCGGRELCSPDYVVERRTFPFYAVEFVTAGEGRLKLGRKSYRLRPGATFCYGPGVPHRIENDPARPMRKYYVDFTGERGLQLLEASPVRPGAVTQVTTPGEIRELYEALGREGARESPYSRSLCAALIPVLLLKISERAMPYRVAPPRALGTYEEARKYLEEHYLELASLDDAARGCGLAPAYLCRLFQRFDHQSPYRFLLRLKMHRATQLLLDQGLSVKGAAAALDFADPYNFSRAFKSVYGISPQTFVRQGQRQ